MDQLTFKTYSIFDSVAYDKDGDSWRFSFSDIINFTTQTIWRLLKNRKIQWVSLDNGQQFGLQTPIDLIEKLTSDLTGKHLLEIIVKPNTADLLLNLTDNLQIEIFICSSGYESYNFTMDRKNYIGMGSGDIAIYDYK
jgi:hypothetical protein